MGASGRLRLARGRGGRGCGGAARGWWGEGARCVGGNKGAGGGARRRSTPAGSLGLPVRRCELADLLWAPQRGGGRACGRGPRPITGRHCLMADPPWGGHVGAPRRQRPGRDPVIIGGGLCLDGTWPCQEFRIWTRAGGREWVTCGWGGGYLRRRGKNLAKSSVYAQRIWSASHSGAKPLQAGRPLATAHGQVDESTSGTDVGQAAVAAAGLAFAAPSSPPPLPLPLPPPPTHNSYGRRRAGPPGFPPRRGRRRYRRGGRPLLGLPPAAARRGAASRLFGGTQGRVVGERALGTRGGAGGGRGGGTVAGDHPLADAQRGIDSPPVLALPVGPLC